MYATSCQSVCIVSVGTIIAKKLQIFHPFDPTSVPSLQGASSNKFVNDGSFLQQFMKMQKEKSNNVSGR